MPCDVALYVMMTPKDPGDPHVGDDPKTRRKKAGAYLRGDVVECLPFNRCDNGHNLNVDKDGDGPGRMRIIRVRNCPGAFPRFAAWILEPYTDAEQQAKGDQFQRCGRTKHKFDAIALLNAYPVRHATLNNEGMATFTWDQMREFCRNEDGSLVKASDIRDPREDIPDQPALP